MDKQEVLRRLEEAAHLQFGCPLQTLTPKQAYRVSCSVVQTILTHKNADFSDRVSENGQKHVYYLSMEFLVGTSLKNNLFNLGLLSVFEDVLSENGINLYALFEIEPDAGLGNGGLGRLASCYMDAATTASLPMTGFSIRYEFGIFKQKIIDGWQMEFPDDWLGGGEVWLRPRPDDTAEIRFGGHADEWVDETGYSTYL